jgi:hypothetical protein
MQENSQTTSKSETTTKRKRATRYQWLRETHYNEILSSWDAPKCLAYLSLSECTQIKLPGEMPLAQIKERVFQKLQKCLKGESQQPNGVDFTTVVHTLNLQQCLIDIAFPELKLPCLIVSNGNTDNVLRDVQRVHQNALRVVNFMTQHNVSDIIGLFK